MNENEVLFIRSSKKNLSKSSEGDSSTNEDDVWDDTLLIQAYDKAVHLAQQSCLKKKQGGDVPGSSKFKKKENGNSKWKVGDKCKCQYSEDLQYYEADIVEILKSGMCVVKYIGYENEEKVPIKKLKPSEGEEARSRQMRQALEDNEIENGMEVEESSINSAKKTQPNFVRKKGNSKSRQSFSENGQSFKPFNFPFPPLGNAIIPPPPPPHMFNNLGEDEDETEAMSAMLISWYMSGYHTGYYQGLKMAKKQ